MRVLLLIFIGVSLIANCFSAGANASSQPASVVLADPFSRTPTYRQVYKLDNGDISPFNKPAARALQAATQVKVDGPNASAVLAKFSEMGLTGVIPSTPARVGTIVLGGNIYREGAALEQFNPKSRSGVPLVADHTVILQSVTAQALQLSVKRTSDIERAPTMVPVILLEFLQR